MFRVSWTGVYWNIFCKISFILTPSVKEFLREEFQQFQHKGLHLARKRKENSENSLLLLFSFCWFFVLADNDYFLLLLLLMLWCWSTALHCFDVDILMLINRVALFCCWSTVVHCFYVDCWSTGLHCFDVVPARLVGGCCWTTLAACAPFFSETVATSPPPRSHTPSILLRPKTDPPSALLGAKKGQNAHTKSKSAVRLLLWLSLRDFWLKSLTMLASTIKSGQNKN